MRKNRNIAVLAVLTIVCAWMAGCAGCNPEPLPSGMNPTQGPETVEQLSRLPVRNLI